MPRIEPLSPEEMSAEARTLIDKAKLNGTPDHRVISIYARNPLGIAHFEAFFKQVAEPTDLSIRLKELIRLQISVSNECGYCTVMRSTAAEAEGVTEDLVAEMLDFEFSDAFSEAEKVALRFADTYKHRPDELAEDTLWEALKSNFTDSQIIELGLLCGRFVGGSPFVKAMQLVSWAEACEVTPKLQEVLRRKRLREATRAAAE